MIVKTLTNNFKERLALDLLDPKILTHTKSINFGVRLEFESDTNVDADLFETNSDQFICYQITDRKHIGYCGDKHLGDEYIVEIDIFSKGNYIDLENAVIETLESKDYLFQREYEVYLTEKELYECILIFKYVDLKTN